VKKIRIGAGAGFSGDRIDPAVELACKGSIKWLVFECLAERTIAIAQKARLLEPEIGYDPLLEERMEAVLPVCAERGIRIVSNMGAANPRAAVLKTREIARRLGIRGLRIAAVTGDDVLPLIRRSLPSLPEAELAASDPAKLVSANAYLGAEPILAALNGGADVVLTGRVADPSLFLAILLHEFGWSGTDWRRLGEGTVVGHLLECAGQLTGGYFADPGYSDVPGLAHAGFPIAEVSEDGGIVLSKVEGSGGLLNIACCTQQLLYEVQNPAAYVTPDVTADFSRVCFEQIAADQVRVTGADGEARPDSLKVSVGIHDGYIGEGQISYAGPGALGRAQLARDILRERLRDLTLCDLRFDFIGVSSIAGSVVPTYPEEPFDVRLRVAGRSHSRKTASMIAREVEALYTNGPAGGGGVSGCIRETIGIISTFIQRSAVTPEIHFEVS
jgi:Acyclic terpene utilisation family protein AtuA